MRNRMGLLVVSAVLLAGAVTNLVLAQGGIPPTMKIVIPCGGVVDDGGHETQESGSVCGDYACNSQAARDLAVGKANEKVVKALKKNHVCQVCDEDTGVKCTMQAPSITSPFTSSDCTFTCETGCGGDPDFTRIKASCEADLGWSIGCDDC